MRLALLIRVNGPTAGVSAGRQTLHRMALRERCGAGSIADDPRARLRCPKRCTSRLRAMRAQSNFAEYVPLELILISMVELQAAAPLVVHGLGVARLAGRAAHAWGVSQVRENFAFRAFGMAMTLGTIIVCAGFLLWAFVVG